MTYIVLCVAAVLFLVALKYTGLMGRVSEAMGVARGAMVTLASPEMTDDEKEAAARAAAIGMFGAFFAILARLFVILGLPLLLVLVTVGLGVVDVPQVEAAATNWYFLIGSTLAMVALWKVVP
jgi:hypothetical protein